MSGPITVVPPRQSLVDDRGHITRVWWLFFQEIFTRIGGANAPTNLDLQTLIEELASTPAPVEPLPFPDDLTPVTVVMPTDDDLSPTPEPVVFPDDLTPPVVVVASDDWAAMCSRLSSLESESTALRTQINDLLQGLQP